MNRLNLLVLGMALVVGGCAAAPEKPSAAPSDAVASPTPASTASTATPTATASPDPWAEDLAILDRGVRSNHPDPFAIHPESEWTAKLAALPVELAGATPEQQHVRLSELVGLLDTHSFLAPPFGFHAYEVLPYRFSDGWFVIRAKDPSLIGSRLVSIGGTPAEDVEAALKPLMPSDNEMGDLDGIEGPMVYVEWLTGLGIVDDPAAPGFVFEKPDGTQVMVDLSATDEASWAEELGVIGDLVGSAPEAVARRTEAAWTRLDKPTKTLLLSYNDYEEVLLPKAIAAMRDALDDGSATRVVLDMRYLRGGNGSLAQPLIDALASDPRINRPDGLTILIGRENVSAGTLTASLLDEQTQAIFVGEPTPARADNFLCRCQPIPLPNSGFTLEVPTYTRNTGDTRDAIRPDIAMPLASADFFASTDPVLDAVLAGAGS